MIFQTHVVIIIQISKIKEEMPIYIYKCYNIEKVKKTKVLSKYIYREKSIKGMSFQKGISKCIIGIEGIFLI